MRGFVSCNTEGAGANKTDYHLKNVNVKDFKADIIGDIKNVIEKMKAKNAAILAVKTIDTIKKADETGKIISTIDRSNLYNVQTPQGFKFDLIYNAHKKLEKKSFTDDSGMLETLGKDVYIVDGDYSNFKITTKNDFENMKNFLELEKS